MSDKELIGWDFTVKHFRPTRTSPAVRRIFIKLIGRRDAACPAVTTEVIGMIPPVSPGYRRQRQDVEQNITDKVTLIKVVDEEIFGGGR